MKKIILLFVLTLATLSLFSQNDRDSAILRLMNAKKGMVPVNSLAASMTKNLDSKQAASFNKEMAVYKKELVKAAITKFKAEYTSKEIEAIYNEFTSDKINYSDLTLNFLKKWRKLKGDLYFSKAKQTYFKHQ